MIKQGNTFRPFRLRVLIVEDDALAANALAQLLGNAGHKVEVVEEGFDAVRAVEERHPDVVLLDIHLPGLNGWDVAERIKATNTPKKAFIVAITGYSDEEDQRRSYEAGIDLHLTKPINVDYLQRMLRRFESFVAPLGTVLGTGPRSPASLPLG